MSIVELIIFSWCIGSALQSVMIQIYSKTYIILLVTKKGIFIAKDPFVSNILIATCTLQPIVRHYKHLQYPRLRIGPRTGLISSPHQLLHSPDG
jgi:hypothetical protein